jgi:hypothetical protein
MKNNSNRMNYSVDYIIKNYNYSRQIPLNHFPRLKVVGIGPQGVNDFAADLIDIASAVIFIEGNLKGNQYTNRVLKISVEMGLRVPEIWTDEIKETLYKLLLFMGWINWEFKFFKITHIKNPKIITKETGKVEKVSLFSGGLDSLCGAATEKDDNRHKLISFYSKQKELQKQLASKLDMIDPIQWSVYNKRGFKRQNTSNYYRSFLFLCLAAVTAQSYNATKIQQFENGILASGIPFSISSRSTKHAHYYMHRLCEEIFSTTLECDFKISNPFSKSTKRDEYKKLIGIIGELRANELASHAPSCWHLNAGYKYNGQLKKNGEPCGICVPCIIRQTAHPIKTWLSLQDDDIRNDPVYGRNFREYYSFLSKIKETSSEPLQNFYIAIGSQVREAIKPKGEYELSELRDIFLQFADEFSSTFQVNI